MTVFMIKITNKKYRTKQKNIYKTKKKIENDMHTYIYVYMSIKK